MILLSSGRARIGAVVLLTLSLLVAACGSGGSEAGSDPADNDSGISADTDGDADVTDEPAGPSTSDGSDSNEPDPDTTVAELSVVRPINVVVSERSRASANPEPAGSAVTSLGFDLFSAARRIGPRGDEAMNLTVSPASVAFALSMLEPGAVDGAQGELRALLTITNADRFHASMNSLQDSLENREPGDYGDGDPGEITMRVANAAYLQTGYPFEKEYLATVGSNYGPILYEVDFRPDPDAVARGINQFVAAATEDQITDLIADGVITPATVLALVNALYMKASWLEPFDAAETEVDTFTRLDGSSARVDMMQGSSSSSAEGDGWIGATKSYTGGLEAQFILPDEGRFDEIASDLSSVFSDYERNRTSGTDFALPRFEVRASVELDDALQSLGLRAPYERGGLLGIADDERLVVYKVIHETFVAMDEEGTEAAAATVVLGQLLSRAPAPSVPVVLDRPFLYRIIDRETGATLFIGQILDPIAG